jgi:O-antigen/teichoic acid export membrane protein
MLFYHLGILTLINIICLNGFLYVLALLLYFLFIFNINDLYQSSSVSILKHISDVKGFCYPLIPYLLISSGYKFVDSWLLQYNSGYEQQGIFAISSKISALSMVLVSALVKVLWREVSYFEGKGERASSWKLYSKASLFITCIGMFFACFIWPFSGVIIELLLGPDYIDAIIPFTIMLFVPTYIGLGQLAGMYYYSIEETRLFSLIGGVTVILGGIASYLLLSNDFLALGSVGLSIKSLSFEIISVIAMILVLNKITSLSGFIKKHIILVSFFFVLSYVINLSLVSFTSNVTLKFIIYCVFYFCITSVFLLKLDDYIFDGEIKNTRLKLVRSIISDKK